MENLDKVLDSLNMVNENHKKDVQEWIWQLCFNVEKVSLKYELNTESFGIHSDLMNYDDDKWDGSFKIYHSNGYCIDIEKEYGDTFKDVNFSTYEEWEGFEKIGEGKWLKILSDLCENIKSEAYFKMVKNT